MSSEIHSVLLRRTQRILQIDQYAWGLYVLGFAVIPAPRMALVCLLEAVLAFILRACSRRWPHERARRRIAHALFFSMALGLTTNALLCGAENASTIPYFSCVPLFAALLLGSGATLLWAGIMSALLWVTWWLGPHVPREFVMHGPVLVASHTTFVLLVGAVAVAYDRVTAAHVRAIEQTQLELRAARDAAVASARAVREILDNVTFGFFILGRDLRVQGHYTRSCVSFFGTQEIARRRLPEILPDLREDEALAFEMQMEQVFADLLPPELCLGQAQQRFVHGDRVLHIEGRALRDGAEVIQGVLFTISDVTELESSQEQAGRHKLLVELLHNREAFLEFVRETLAALETAAELLARGDEPACRFALHTIKGNAGACGLARLMALVHEIESHPVIEQADLLRMRQELRDFLLANRRVLDIDPDDTAREVLDVSIEQISALEAEIARLPEGAQGPLRAWVARVHARPGRIFLGPIEQMVRRIVERTGKQARLEARGLDTPVDPQRMGGVLQAVQHLIRNAVDHGLEPPEERGGKPACGVVFVDLSRAAEGYAVSVEDDGRGIDTRRLVAKALALGQLTPDAAAALSAPEALDLIFSPGLSTAEEVTDISGRGVGMSSIRAAVNAAGGSLTVETRLGQGTRFRIFVPQATLTSPGGPSA